MAAPSSIIRLNFGWKGPNRKDGGWQKGGLDVGVVDLVFKNAIKTEISVSLPWGIAPAITQGFRFTMRDCNGTFPVETHPDSLLIPKEEIQALVINLGIFEKSSVEGPAVMDSSGKVTRELRVFRSDRQISFVAPKDLEAGGTYRLVITSQNTTSYQAEFVKEGTSVAPIPTSAPSTATTATSAPIATAATSPTKEQMELVEYRQHLSKIIIAHMSLSFKSHLTRPQVLSTKSVTMKQSIDVNSVVTEIVHAEVQKLQDQTIAELMKKHPLNRMREISRRIAETDPMLKGLNPSEDEMVAIFGAVDSVGIGKITRLFFPKIVSDANGANQLIDEFLLKRSFANN